MDSKTILLQNWQNQTVNLLLYNAGEDRWVKAFSEDLIGYLQFSPENGFIQVSKYEMDQQTVSVIYIKGLTETLDIRGTDKRILYANQVSQSRDSGAWSSMAGKYLFVNTLESGRWTYKVFDSENVEASRNQLPIYPGTMTSFSYHLVGDTLYGIYSDIDNKPYSYVYLDQNHSNFQIEGSISNRFYPNGTALIYQNGKYGLANLKGEVLVENADQILLKSETEFLYQKDGMVSYLKVNPDLTATILGDYQSINFQNGGISLLKDAGRNAYLKDGEIIDFNTEDILNATQITAFTNGKALFKSGDTYYLILEANQSIVEIGKDTVHSGIVGEFIFNNDALYRLELDENNQVLLTSFNDIDLDQINFESMVQLEANLYQFSLESGFGLLAYRPQTYDFTRVTGTYSAIQALNGKNGLFRLTTADNKFGIIDAFGHVILEPIYPSIDVQENFLVAGVNGGVKLYDYSGNSLLEGRVFTSYRKDELPTDMIFLTDDNEEHLFALEGTGYSDLGAGLFVRPSRTVPDTFEYSIQGCNSDCTQGLIDKEGRILIDLSEGFSFFNYDATHRLIVPFVNWQGPRGLYELDGTQVLTKDYQVNFDGNRQKITVDEFGFAQVYNYAESILYRRGYQDSFQKQPNMNILNLATREMVLEEDVLYIFEAIQGSLWQMDRLGRKLDQRPEYGNYQSYFEKLEDGSYVESYYLTESQLTDENYIPVLPFKAGQSIQRIFGAYIQYSQTDAEGNTRSGLMDLNGNTIFDPDYYYIDYNSKTEVFRAMKYVDLYDVNHPTDEDKKIIGSDENGFYKEALFLSSSGKLIDSFDRINQGDLYKDGYIYVSRYTGYYRLEDWSPMPFPLIRQGLLAQDGSYLLEPVYDMVNDVSQEGYVKFGNYTNAEGEYESRIGLLNIKTGEIILDPIYENIDTTFYRRNNWTTPTFDKDGLIKLYSSFTNALGYQEFLEGLATRDGALFDGASYIKAYFQNGYYYLWKTDGTWDIVSKDLSETLTIELRESENTITGIEMVDDYFIIKTQVYSEFGSYDNYGVLNRNDLSTYLSTDYSEISFDPLTHVWTLERYNTAFNAYQTALMNEDQSYIVPFESRYDTLSPYAGNFAVGQSGTKTVDQPEPLLSRAFTLNVNASEDNFILDVLNKDGYIVGDLSQEYESARMLGQDADGNVKALVTEGGKTYIATLTTSTVELIPLTGVKIAQNALTLMVDESVQLDGQILPANTNEPRKIIWSSSDESVAAVDGKGHVRALKAGTAVIRFSVNNFTSSVTVTVKAPSQPVNPSTPLEERLASSITNANTTTKTPINPSLSEQIIQLTKVLAGTESLSQTKTQALIKSLFENNIDIIGSLTNDEAKAFEQLLLKTYPDQLEIIIEGYEGKLTLESLILNTNLKDLVQGKKFSYIVKVSDSLNSTDQGILDSYLKGQDFDPEKIFSLDIRITLTQDGQTSELHNLSHPVTLHAALPEAFKGLGELKMVRIHQGQAEFLNVRVNPDQSFSFSSDRFSSFTLVSKQAKPLQPESSTSGSNFSTGSWVMGAMLGGFVLLGAVIIGFLSRKVRKAQ